MQKLVVQFNKNQHQVIQLVRMVKVASYQELKQNTMLGLGKSESRSQ